MLTEWGTADLKFDGSATMFGVGEVAFIFAFLIICAPNDLTTLKAAF